ncbi:hypothetical protein FACS1894204_12000 [Synergistales bacterium]|nr:hypothetical protein FACS1894204_12000 [Synergistales bacterium]
MRASVGYGDDPNTFAAGRAAAAEALSKTLRSEPCDFALLFYTARHNAQILRDAVVSVIGDVRVVGGGAAGVISDNRFGYAGDQVALACVWLEDAKCEFLSEGGLTESEERTGERLGQKLTELGTSPDSPVMLFYDAIDRTGGDVRILAATRLLAGIERTMGFLPDITGAGMMGDYICSSTPQWCGGEAPVAHHALALAFSGNIRVDSVIMHGCKPATGYYRVTKTDGQIILEIEGRAAVPFIEERLGQAIPPDAWPFFLLLGINRGDKWGVFEEDNYASRLCLAIDSSRGGIVMFEPDIVAGMEIQIMYRSLDHSYMKPAIERVFSSLAGRRPVFAVYIDCAGRAAGYGGIDLEDAVILQETIAGRVPILGMYTGVEIARVQGRPCGLDWTGVFCLFSVQK